MLRYIEPVGENTNTIMPRMAFATIPSWGLGEWLIPVAGVIVTVYVTPTVVKVGGEIIDSTSKTFNNILNAIKQAKKSKESGKEKANDVPSWAKGENPKHGESGKEGNEGTVLLSPFFATFQLLFTTVTSICNV